MTINNEHKKLNAPNLRFPEFQGEWEKCKLGELTTKVGSGSTPKGGNAVYTSVGHCFVRSQNVGMGYLILDDIAHIDDDIHQKHKATELSEDDVLLNITGASIGRTAIATKEIEGGNVNQHVCIIRANSKVSPKFLCNYIQTKKIQNYIRSLQTGGSREGLNFEQIRSFPISLPSIAEQNKIAQLLDKLNERIATQNKIIEDLKKLKCAIIEKHYRQAKLHKYKICDLGVPFSVGSLSKEDLSEEGYECILYGELFTTYSCVINEVKSHTNKIANTTLSQKGDLLFPSSTTVDAVSLISPSVIDIPNVILGGDMFGIHIDKKFNAYYLSYYINLIARKKLAIYAKGSTIIHLHYKDIAKAQLLLPDLCEQDKIAKCMMAEDAKIKVEEQLLTILEKQKQYLLRQMFI